MVTVHLGNPQALTTSNSPRLRTNSRSDGDRDDDLMEAAEEAAKEEEDGTRWRSEFTRLKSFPQQWEGCYQKRILTRNGFYYKGSGVTVKCFSCRAELEAVNTGADVQDLHRTIGPNCELVHGGDAGNVALGDVTNYRLEKHRLVTFLSTSWTAPVDLYDLAKWGFYWTGTADVGRCNFCRLEVRGWEQGDTGHGEHVRWNPACAFIRGLGVGNVPLGQEDEWEVILHEPVHVTGHTEIQTSLEYTGVNYSGSHHPTVAELGVTLTAPPRHPEYSTLPSRVYSFVMWPLSMRQRPEHLAEAGFYYTGKGDCVTCYQCGGGLKDWAPEDEPWLEHALWFPSCSFLLVRKGHEFVSKAEATKQEIAARQQIQNLSLSMTSEMEYGTNECSTSNANVLTTSEKLKGKDEDVAAANAVDNRSGGEQQDTSRLCKVCLDNELGIVFLPCGHMAACTTCAPQLASCPICRARTNAYVRAFLP